MSYAGKTAALLILPLLLLLQACGGGFEGDDNRNPTVTITASTTSGSTPLTVTFTITSSDSDGTVDKVEGDFDGDGAFEEDITGLATWDVTYTASAIVTVTVRATDNDGRTSTATVVVLVADKGEVLRTIPYPVGVFDVRDVVYDRFSNTLWLHTSDRRLVGIDPASGVIIRLIRLTNPVFFSTILRDVAFDGNFFWITSTFGAQDIFQVNLFGAAVGGLPCRSTVAGLCSGITFDGSAYWTGATDTKTLARFTGFGFLLGTLPSPAPLVGIDDLAYDRGADQLIVVASNPRAVYRVNPSTGAVVDSFADATLGQKGDWDGSLFWFVDNGGQQLRGVFID